MLKGSGSVASLQMSGFLRREGYQYVSISGYYRADDLYEEILDHCKAFAIQRSLKHTKCGVLPFRCDQMTTTYVDEFVLRKLYGVELTYLELTRFKAEARRITDDEIQRFKKLLQDEEYEIGVDEKNLTEGIRYAIAMEKIITEYGLSMLAMNDVTVEMHQAFGLRPCLTNPRLTRAGVVVAMEADIAACVAMHILFLVIGESPFYTEIFTADLKKNALLMGHAGYHDPTCRDKAYPLQVIHDVEYENSDPFKGACTYFKYRPGPVTVVNSVYNGEKLQWTVFEGMSLEGPPILEGNCHLFCGVDIPLKRFYEQAIGLGVSQHWIVFPGIHKEGLKRLCRWLNIDYFLIDSR
jgi:L-arabinose isomerase